MKKINISVTILILAAVLTVGCGGGEDRQKTTESGLVVENTTPIIDKILFTECIYQSQGVYFRYTLFYIDQEMDAINVIVTFHRPTDYFNIYKGPIVIPMDYDFVTKVVLQDFTYSYEPQLGCGDYPTEAQQQLSIPSLGGVWKIDFQIEDSQSNESETVSVYYERVL